MQRVPEPELMDEKLQAKAYAEADFSEPHNQFIEQIKLTFTHEPQGLILDLGCGPADISIRFANAFPNTIVHGLDGAKAMLDYGYQAVEKADLSHRVELYQGLIQSADLPLSDYDGIISNSLLHHIHDPKIFWQAVKQFSHPRSFIFIMDLMRPEDESQLQELVLTYAANEPEILQRDFCHSLMAAFTPQEIEQQLIDAELGYLDISVTSDRHCIITGIRQ